MNVVFKVTFQFCRGGRCPGRHLLLLLDLANKPFLVTVDSFGPVSPPQGR